MSTATLRLRPAMTLALVIGLLLPTVVTSWYTLAKQRELQTVELRSLHSRVTTMLALGMQQPLWTMASPLGAPLVDSLMEDPRVIQVRVATDQAVFLERRHEARRSGAPTWRCEEPVVVGGETIGRVLVELDTGKMEADLAGHTRRFVLTTLAQLILSLSIIFLLLQVKVLQPVRRLVQQSEALARRDLAEPFKWRTRDELGQLGQSFESTRRSLLELFTALDRQNRELVLLNQRLHDALAARDVLLGNMSHELRTPLNAVIGFSGVLSRHLDKIADERDRRMLQHIIESGERLLRLIDDVLDLALLDTGTPELRPEDVDVNQLVEGLAAIVRAHAEKRNVTVELRLAPEVRMFRADPSKLKQIVYHLLANAVKFSNPGSTVTVSASARCDREGLQIEVADHGIGIAPENLELIFEEFRQVDGSPGRKYEGAGLGLALVKRFVELHGGSIHVASQLGAGSTFTVLLPAEPGQEDRS